MATAYTKKAPSPEGAPVIQLDNLTKRFGSETVVNGLSLAIHSGEFFSVLGPSGCGKTTTLRMIAGLEPPTAGDVYLNGRLATSLPPHKRELGMVFQSYALFPHMPVSENVAYGLKARRLSKSEIEKRVLRYLSLVGLSGMEGRKPRELSGGQRQRVALARSLAIEPSVLLFDEPLSNLDAELREQMQVELKTLQRELGFTAFYVTHDQAEALSLSDRLAVLRHGRLEQIGSPQDVFERPESPYVATFLGGTNLFAGTLLRQAGEWVFVSSAGLRWSAGRLVGRPEQGKPASLSIRPQAPVLDDSHRTGVPGMIENIRYLGHRVDYRIRFSAQEAMDVSVQQTHAAAKRQPGDRVWVTVSADACTVYCEAGGEGR